MISSKVTIEIVLIILLVIIGTFFFPEKSYAYTLQKKKPAISQPGIFPFYSDLHSKYYEYHNSYSNFYKLMFLNKHWHYNRLDIVNEVIYSNFIIFGGSFNLIKLNYTLPITKNIMLWWKGTIPGIYRSENRVGISYSGKFNALFPGIK